VTAALFLGVDPGLPGGFGVLDERGEAVACGLGVGDGTEGLDPSVLEALTRARYVLSLGTPCAAELHAAIESFPPRPGGNVKSLAVLFLGVGAWRLAIRASGWPAPRSVAPQSWQALSEVRVLIRSHEAEVKASPKYLAADGKRRVTLAQEARKRGYHEAACVHWPALRVPGMLLGPKGGARTDVAAGLWIAEWLRREHPLAVREVVGGVERFTVAPCAPDSATYPRGKV
jgi:hypothetical protein